VSCAGRSVALLRQCGRDRVIWRLEGDTRGGNPCNLDQVLCLGYRISGIAEKVFIKIEGRHIQSVIQFRIDAGRFTTYVQYFIR
jgi:hypothetical protein